MTVRTGRVNGLPCVQIVESTESIRYGKHFGRRIERTTPWMAGLPDWWPHAPSYIEEKYLSMRVEFGFVEDSIEWEGADTGAEMAKRITPYVEEGRFEWVIVYVPEGDQA